MLTIGIHYLNGWAMGKHPSSHERPEWPPHPDRVYMALAAAYFETEKARDEREALEWLENSQPPTLLVSHFHKRSTLTSYVPVNDTEISRRGSLENRLDRIGNIDSLKKLKDAGLSLLPEQRSRQERHFPVAIPDSPTVYLTWPDAKPSTEHVKALSHLCRKVTYIGHSASLVQMWVQDGPPEGCDNGVEATYRTLVPIPLEEGRTTRYRLRIAGEGRLEQLKTYNPKETTFRPTSSLWCGYDELREEPTSPHVSSSCFQSDVLIFRKIEGRPLGLESTLQVTKAFRDTIMSECAQPPPEWISGHKEDNSPSEKDHAAFFPLPHVGREHADGHFLGLAMALPRGLPVEELSRCLRDVLYDDLGDLRRLELRLGRLGVWTIQLEETLSRPVTLRPETWTAAPPSEPADKWGTVTPIALDRHAKGKNKWQRVEEFIKKACKRIGLPWPDNVVLARVSMFIGTPHACQFPRIRRKSDGGQVFHTHAVITFPEPVSGPVLLGAGRYRGYGLCRPLYRGGGSWL